MVNPLLHIHRDIEFLWCSPAHLCQNGCTDSLWMSQVFSQVDETAGMGESPIQAHQIFSPSFFSKEYAITRKENLLHQPLNNKNLMLLILYPLDSKLSNKKTTSAFVGTNSMETAFSSSGCKLEKNILWWRVYFLILSFA